MTTLNKTIIGLQIIVMAIMLSIPAGAFSQNSPEFTKIEAEQEVEEQEVTAASLALAICPSVLEMAENTMRARQNGIPMSTMIELSNTLLDGMDEGGLKSIFEVIMPTMINMAYDEPQYRSAEYQSAAIQRFGVEIDRQCMIAITAMGEE